MATLKDLWDAWKLEGQANQQENVANRLEREFGNTYGAAHKFRCQAAANRLEADIKRGKVKPINQEYMD